MCGIVGYIGPQPAHEVLLDGLQRLEYRGYDSAGIAVMNGGAMRILRAEGKLARLEQLVTAEPPQGHLGIGHTRWATHGRPSDANAHPHKCGRVAIIHNGIIENHVSLRRELAARGQKFLSETDSEILAHVVNDAWRDGADGIAQVRQALQRVRGVYAFCCLIDGVTDRLYCGRHEVPLILGVGEGEMFAASDIPAILQHTRQVIFLEDGDVAELRADGYRIVDARGQAVERPIQHITWSAVMAEKEGYKHFMLKEIHEQSRAITDTLRGRLVPETGQIRLEELQCPPPTGRIFLTACGTAYHACLVGKFFLEATAKLPSECDLASEFRYRDPLIGPNDLLVAVSQSGETADTRAAVLEAQRKGARVLAITNVVGSSIARIADSVLYTYAGPEIGVASTKAFTTQLVALQLLSIYFGQQRGIVSPEVSAQFAADLSALPHQMQAVLQQADHIQAIAECYLEATDWLYLGRGVNYPIALEGALKLKEISYAHAEGYAAGEMKHGPIALIDEHLPVVGIVPQGEIYDKVLNNLQEVKARGGHLIAIATEGDEHIADLADHVVYLPAVRSLLQPLLTVLPLQLLAYFVADARGTDVDQPRNLAKSVTVE